MTFNKKKFKNLKNIFVYANQLHYRCDFFYEKDEDGAVSYKVTIESPNNVKSEHLFLWYNKWSHWECVYPELLTAGLITALIEKIEQIESSQ